jgi:RHS repeat-associated protein
VSIAKIAPAVAKVVAPAGKRRVRPSVTASSAQGSPHAHRAPPRTTLCGASYEYDADGNVIRRGGQYLRYDSDGRLECVGSAPGQCDIAVFRYDVDGTRISETTAAGSRILMGDLFEWEVGSSKATSNVMAFGRRIAYQYSWNQTLRPAWVPPGWELPVAPRWLGPGIALVALSLALAYLLWLAARGAAISRPLPAALQLLVMASLLIPNPAWAGGGGGATYLRRWISPDHLGNAVLYTEPGGAGVKRRVFEPFGKLVAQTATTEATPRLFTGQRYEASSGLYDFRARWYDPEAGRFLSVDPIVQEVADPQTHNAYGYVRNNPVNFVDPDGLGFLKGLLKALLVIVGLVMMVVGVVAMAIGYEWGSALVAAGWKVVQLGVVSNATSNLLADAGSSMDDPTMRTALLAGGVLRAQTMQANSFHASGETQSRSAGSAQTTCSDCAEPSYEFEILGAIYAGARIIYSGLRYGLPALGRWLANRGGREVVEEGAEQALKISPKIERQMARRGWTSQQVDEAVRSGKQVRAVNKATGNPATRYVHPDTGQSVVIDDVTGEVVHVGGPGFSYGLGSGDLP